MVDRPKGPLKNNFTFYTAMHLFRLYCESSESAAADSSFLAPLLERDDTSILKNCGAPLAARAPQRAKL